MPKILQITVDGNAGSTGRIAESIGLIAIDFGWQSYIAHAIHPRESASKIIRIGSKFDLILHALKTRFFDAHGLGSKRATKKLIKLLKSINPDVILLHHLHGYYINIQVLFEYLSQISTPIVWVFHDCWSFTGHCTHYDFVGCEKWKNECSKCPQKREYPASLFLDRSKYNFRLKKKLFTSVKNMTVVSVSKWLNDQVKLSFFNKYPNKVIYNGIDVNIFSPSNNTLSIRNIHKVENKFLILGVAGVWSKKKGLLDFIMLSNKLDENFQIILIGLNKDQLKDLPKNIIGIPLTENLSELSDYYSAADVYVNLSVEETFGLTTAEALSCGTPAIVYNSTACPELVDSETGIIVEKNNINDLVLAIEQVREKGKSSYASSCRKRALNIFDKNERFLEYINLFEDLVKT